MLVFIVNEQYSRLYVRFETPSRSSWRRCNDEIAWEDMCHQLMNPSIFVLFLVCNLLWILYKSTLWSYTNSSIKFIVVRMASSKVWRKLARILDNSPSIISNWRWQQSYQEHYITTATRACKSGSFFMYYLRSCDQDFSQWEIVVQI